MITFNRQQVWALYRGLAACPDERAQRDFLASRITGADANTAIMLILEDYRDDPARWQRIFTEEEARRQSGVSSPGSGSVAVQPQGESQPAQETPENTKENSPPTAPPQASLLPWVLMAFGLLLVVVLIAAGLYARSLAQGGTP